MPTYQYKALAQGGEMLTGTMLADDMAAFYTNMYISNLQVIKVKEVSQKGFNALLQKISSRQIPRKDVIELSSNLSVMIEAGVPVLSALDDLIETASTGHIRNKLTSLKRQLLLGSSLSDAISRESAAFPDIFVRLVRIGEETGTLAKNLNDVAEHLQRIEDLSSVIKRALMYPIFAITITLMILAFWVVYVLPKMNKLFSEMEIKLPAFTRFLFELSDTIPKYWYFILVVPVLAVAFQMSKRNEKVRYFLDYMKLHVPIFKLVIYNMLVSMFVEQLRILVLSGITLSRSLELLQDTIKNVIFRKAFVNINEMILSGTSLTEAIKTQKLFPALVIRMISVGEVSGSLDEQLGFLSKHYEKVLNAIADRMSKIIEPVIMLFLGGFVAIIVIGLILPIYDMLTSLAKM
ncbi:MAG: type II secretion system F family protein [Candidatus Magnetominusculus sp. LBB02]|nr:type II secretion system F family protein [Candidatus Magnetominusculus sp. LBB02]MCG6553142.1 type II secretion system F family protein [Candidatus Magnetominusculus sp. LBB02]